MKRVPLTVLSVVVILAVVTAGAFWRISGSRSQGETATRNTLPSEYEETQTPEPVPGEFGGSFSLTDQYGMRRTDMDFRGKYMLIFFGYTYCPDVCPTTLAVEKEALDKLGALANRIVPIFITVDPKRDTPDKLKSYLSSFDASQPSTRPNFVGLTGTDEEIAKTAKAYRVYYRAHLDGFMAGAAGYSIDHTGDVYLMGPDGKFVAYYSQGILSDEMAADLMLKTSPG
ncbi:MAG TPA: SCO family protein [Micropepsaceae bacterium]|nr:SCO family protein [Micropepsaceae bacterium]